jgi:HEAT repeat protein
MNDRPLFFLVAAAVLSAAALSAGAAETPRTTAPPAAPQPAAPPAPAPIELPLPSFTDPRQRSIDVLVEASMGDAPALRSNALEAIQVMPDRALPLTQKGLVDPNPAVRFAAVVTAGKMKFNSLATSIEPLLKDPNPSVQAAAIFALHTMGSKIDITPLATMLSAKDPGLRSNVALLLGMMGDASAVPMLKDAALATMPRVSASQAAVVRIQIAEAIAKLGDDSSLDALRAGAYSQFDEVRVLAVNAMGEVGDKRMAPAIDKLLGPASAKPTSIQQPVELQLAAAGALARLGSPRGVHLVITHSASDLPVIRAQAAWVLGWFEDEASFQQLVKLLGDPVANVRVSAAASIIRRRPTATAPKPAASAAAPANPPAATK